RRPAEGVDRFGAMRLIERDEPIENSKVVGARRRICLSPAKTRPRIPAPRRAELQQRLELREVEDGKAEKRRRNWRIESYCRLGGLGGVRHAGCRHRNGLCV